MLLPYIKVCLGEIENFRIQTEKSKQKVSKIKQEFYRIGYNLDWDVKSVSNIKKKIQSINKELEYAVVGLKNMGTFLNTATNKYQQTERQNMELPIEKEGQLVVSNTEIVEKFDVVGVLVNSLFGNTGFSGDFISSLASVFASVSSSEIDYGALAKGLKDIVNSAYDFVVDGQKLEKLSRMNPGQAIKTGLKRFVGLNKAFVGNLQPSTANNFSTRFYNNFQKQLSNKTEAFTKKGSKSFFSWAGVAVSVVANTIDNISQAQKNGNSAERVFAEIVAETAVETGLNIVVGAAVSAGIAALGFTSAPVIVVSAATGLVLAGADSLCKWATNKAFGESKGLTETISDTALDIGEAIVKGRRKIASDIGDFLKEIF